MSSAVAAEDRPRAVGYRLPLPALALAGVLLLCAGVRFSILASKIARLDSDEAVTGLMARRILAGDDLYIYYAGQQYMGAPEQYLQAAVLAILPDTPFTLRIPEVVLSVATCFFVYLAGLRCFNSQPRALFAATLYASGPYFNLMFGSKRLADSPSQRSSAWSASGSR